ncbi:MAG: hypothetical protein IJ599_01675 [Alphaproteobacteria bacterium]|nr:hypothetical protein [Alphaproteobacteria bacterium]
MKTYETVFSKCKKYDKRFLQLFALIASALTPLALPHLQIEGQFRKIHTAENARSALPSYHLAFEVEMMYPVTRRDGETCFVFSSCI